MHYNTEKRKNPGVLIRWLQELRVLWLQHFKWGGMSVKVKEDTQNNEAQAARDGNKQLSSGVFNH